MLALAKYFEKLIVVEYLPSGVGIDVFREDVGSERSVSELE